MLFELIVISQGRLEWPGKNAKRRGDAWLRRRIEKGTCQKLPQRLR